MLFPRMYSDAHAQAYEDWLGGIKGVQVPYDQCGQMVMVKVPTQWDNIKFFFIYQLNYMYWRYFMWNFAGRQNDIQGQGEIEHGNWITGIPFVDKFLVGDQSLLPSDLKNNKGHNVFYCLPLILGLIGLFWQAYKTKTYHDSEWGRDRRTDRYPAILDRILPVLHDRSGHRTLFEPDPDAAPRT